METTIVKLTAKELKKARKLANTILQDELDDRLEVETLSQRVTKALERSKKYNHSV